MGKKLIPTLLKLAAAALFVPYKVELDRDGGRLKSVKVRSLALQLSYTAPSDGKKAQFDGVVPGFNADKVRFKADGKSFCVDGGELVEDAKAVYDEMKDVAGDIRDAVVEELGDLDLDDLD